MIHQLRKQYGKLQNGKQKQIVVLNRYNFPHELLEQIIGKHPRWPGRSSKARPYAVPARQAGTELAPFH
jgi:hypothetical protein